MSDTETVRADDGRTLAFCQWGNPAGWPVWYLHGTPGSRFLRPAGIDFAELGVRLLTYDRPGYGGSDRRPGRAVADAARDVHAMADHLSLDEFAVVGVSGGGPHALAVAAEIASRVTRCATINGLAPADADDLTFSAGMDLADVAEWRAMTDPDADPAAIHRETLEWIEGLKANTSLPSIVKDMLVAALTEAMRAGPGGLLDDYAALSQPWGFDPAGVSCPTTIMAAEGDTNVPPNHGRWLATHVPRAVLQTVPGGHLDRRRAETEQLLTWAASRP